MSNDDRCEHYQFYRPQRQGQAMGECHERSPRCFELVIPTRSAIATQGNPDGLSVRHFGAWPPTPKDEWCGQFKRKCNS